MKKIVIINDSNIIGIDNESLKCNFMINDNIHCIHFDFNLNIGHIEYKNSKPNLEITIFEYSALIELYNITKIKNNPPFSYSIWNEDLKKFEDDEILKKDLKIQEIYAKLDKIDLKSIRAIREKNQDLINEHENEAIILRQELSLLNA